MRRAIVVLCVVGLGGVAEAGGPIAIESHAATRTDDARALIDPVLDELRQREFRVGAGQVGTDAERISRPASAGALDVRDLSTRAQDGINKWNTGAVEEAAEVLQRLWVDVRLNPAPIALNNSVRESLFRALVTLAMVRARIKAEESAFDIMAEVIRTFPEQVVTRAIFGPDAAKLYESVRKALNQQGRGTLTIKLADDGVQVFINERYAANGATTRADLVPGHYRVYLQRGEVEGRYYIVKVDANAEAVLDVDWSFDAALRTGPYWAGFMFADARQRSASEAAFAVRLAKKLDAPLVVVLAVGKLKGKSALIGTTFETATGNARRSASIAIAPAPSEERLRAFARFLAGDTAASGFDVVEPGGPAEPAPSDATSPPRWLKWTLAGVGVTAIAGGAYLLSIHGDGRCDLANSLCAEEWDTAVGGGVAVGAGVLAVGAATYLVVRDRRAQEHGLALLPRQGGALVTAQWAF